MRSVFFLVRVPGREDMRLFTHEVAIRAAEVELELLISLGTSEDDLPGVSVTLVRPDGSSSVVAWAERVEGRWRIVCAQPTSGKGPPPAARAASSS